MTSTEKILAWAQSTTEYNSILVVIENPESIPSKLMNIFLVIISTMRCVHGIPIGVCLVSISPEIIQKELISNRLDLSSLNGEVGVVIEEFEFVSSKVLVGMYKCQLYHLLLQVLTLLYPLCSNHGSCAYSVVSFYICFVKLYTITTYYMLTYHCFFQSNVIR